MYTKSTGFFLSIEAASEKPKPAGSGYTLTGIWILIHFLNRQKISLNCKPDIAARKG